MSDSKQYVTGHMGGWGVREHTADGEPETFTCSSVQVARSWAQEAFGEGAVRVQIISPDGEIVDDMTAEDEAVA